MAPKVATTPYDDSSDTSYINTPSTPSDPSHDAKLFAIEVIQAEIDAFGIDNTPPYSEGNFAQTAMFNSDRHCADILRGLLWRSRQQSQIFQLFMQLCDDGLCSVAALEKPIDYYRSSEVTRWMCVGLLSFSAVKSLLERGSEVVIFDCPGIGWNEFEFPLVWLSVVLVRSAVSIHNTLDAIETSGLLGQMEKSPFVNSAEPGLTWAPIPDELIARFPDSGPPGYGMMLPSGIKIDDAKQVKRQFFERQNRVQRAFEEFFSVPAVERRSLDYQPDLNIRTQC